MHYYVGDVPEEQQMPKCAYNFQHVNNKCFGYAEGIDNLPLELLEDASEQDDFVEDVMVVWVAKDEDYKYKIVGWYKKAKVYRRPIKKITLDNERLELVYSIEADAKDCTVLPLELRAFELDTPEKDFWVMEDKKRQSEIAMYVHNYAGEKLNPTLTKEDLEKTATLTFDDYERYLIKAEEFQNKSLFHKAIKWCNKAIEEAPEISLAYECKANILLSQKLYDEALKLYKELSQMEENSFYNYCIGLCYGLKEEYEKALPYYDTYLQEEKEDASLFADRAIILYNLGQIDQAKKDLQEAKKLEQDNPFFEHLENVLFANN
jgi:tetratricopeptide (TPR) repeat protein